MGSPPRPESNKREVKIKREVGTPPAPDLTEMFLETYLNVKGAYLSPGEGAFPLHLPVFLTSFF